MTMDGLIIEDLNAIPDDELIQCAYCKRMTTVNELVNDPTVLDPIGHIIAEDLANNLENM